MSEYGDRFERVTDMADPERCQGIAGTRGQCINKSMEHSDFCPVHGGNKGEEAHAKRRLKNYRLHKWEMKIGDKANSSEVKSLRDEIGILRVLMEERLNMIDDATDLILQSGPISELVMKIDKVVTSCNKLEGSMGQLMDKAAVLQFASEVVEIIDEEIGDNPELKAKIADRITESLVNNDNDEE